MAARYSECRLCTQHIHLQHCRQYEATDRTYDRQLKKNANWYEQNNEGHEPWMP